MKKISFVFLFFVLFSSFNFYIPDKLKDQKLPVYYYDDNNRFSYNSDYHSHETSSDTQFNFDSLSIPIKHAEFNSH